MNTEVKLKVLERQLAATQIKLNHISNWIRLRFGEDPYLSLTDISIDGNLDNEDESDSTSNPFTTVTSGYIIAEASDTIQNHNGHAHKAMSRIIDDGEGEPRWFPELEQIKNEIDSEDEEQQIIMALIPDVVMLESAQVSGKADSSECHSNSKSRSASDLNPTSSSAGSAHTSAILSTRATANNKRSVPSTSGNTRNKCPRISENIFPRQSFTTTNTNSTGLITNTRTTTKLEKFKGPTTSNSDVRNSQAFNDYGKCDYCPRRFPAQNSRIHHMGKVHPEELALERLASDMHRVQNLSTDEEDST